MEIDFTEAYTPSDPMTLRFHINDDSNQSICRIMILGPPGTGKTSLLNRIIHDKFTGAAYHNYITQ